MGYAEVVNKPLTITFIKNNPPFSFELYNGKPAGLSVDFWKLWSEINEIPIIISIDDFQEGFDAVKDKKIQIHSGLFRNAERERWAAFSMPLHRIQTSVLYNENFPVTTRLKDMKGHKIAVRKGTEQALFMQKHYPELKKYYYVDGNDVFNKLLDNQVQAIVSEVPFLKAQTERLGLRGVFNLSTEILSSNEVYALVVKENKSLIGTINNGFENIPINKLIELEQKWLPGVKPFFKDRSSFLALSLTDVFWLKQHSNLTLAVDEAFPPFEFIDKNGKYSGISADYIQYAKELLNVDFVIAPQKNWLESLEALKAGEIDLMPGVANIPSRRQDMLFTAPLIHLPLVIINLSSV